jgi:hypothetical protein
MRNRHGHKPADLSQLREALSDDRVWSAVGVVRAREGADSHFEIADGDVLVDVDLSPEGSPTWCRLGSAAGIEGGGVWRVPNPDTEVIVVQVAGDSRVMPAIVATLSSGTAPSGLDGDVLLVVNTKKVRIVSTEEDVEIEAGSGKHVKLGGGAQFVALANLAKDRLDLIQSRYDNHVHTVSVGVAQPVGAPDRILTLASTAAQNVKAT